MTSAEEEAKNSIMQQANYQDKMPFDNDHISENEVRQHWETQQESITHYSPTKRPIAN